jgi:hypothetical protein
MPSALPAAYYRKGSSAYVHDGCDAYTRIQIAAPKNRGIVLATDNTGGVDFMAQPGNAAVQDTTARQIANRAATDAARYARRHRGSFAGLSLATLRHQVPEARSGRSAYLIAARAIDNGTGFVVTARAEGTEDTFTITHRPAGAGQRTCTTVDGGAGRSGCQRVNRGHGRW